MGLLNVQTRRVGEARRRQKPAGPSIGDVYQQQRRDKAGEVKFKARQRRRELTKRHERTTQLATGRERSALAVALTTANKPVPRELLPGAAPGTARRRARPTGFASDADRIAAKRRRALEDQAFQLKPKPPGTIDYKGSGGETYQGPGPGIVQTPEQGQQYPDILTGGMRRMGRFRQEARQEAQQARGMELLRQPQPLGPARTPSPGLHEGTASPYGPATQLSQGDQQLVQQAQALNQAIGTNAQQAADQQQLNQLQTYRQGLELPGQGFQYASGFGAAAVTPTAPALAPVATQPAGMPQPAAPAPAPVTPAPLPSSFDIQNIQQRIGQIGVGQVEGGIPPAAQPAATATEEALRQQVAAGIITSLVVRLLNNRPQRVAGRGLRN